MDSIYFSEELDILRQQIRRFVKEEVIPNGDEWERQGKIPRDAIKRMGELGFLGIRYPEKYGGANLDTLGSLVLAEELGRSSFGGFTVTVLVHTDMASPHLARYGTEEQKEKYLPGIIKGDILTAIAVTEPDTGSDVASLRTKAVRSGNGWVLNGAKTYITNGVHADLLFVAARTDPDAKGSRGISMFAIERDTPGFKVANKLEKMGWCSSDTAELVFEDAKLPADALIGEENRGFYAVMENFQNERMVTGAMAMSEAETAIEITLEYVQNRKTFGGTLWDKQVIRQRLAMLASKVEAGRQLVHRAAWLDAQGRDSIKEVSMVKAFCGELVNEVMYTCQQFHGGFGYMRESTIERMVRDARILAIGAGATEIMLEEVAKRMES
ncbi:MAG: acyl-CoA dehydrogenase family protein [Alphaproteobacteria bacterium]|nr:acyl-CoA dehydrogenase family protein [Alphaproteobacteria bacterium]